jgi:hypothetical protein
MTKKLLSVTTILLVGALAAFAADATGKWTYEQAGRGGGAPTSRTITLKADGAKLTGSVPGFGRGGGDPPPPTEISNGKVDGDKISFQTKMTFGDNEFVIKYEGVISGDEMKLTITRGAMGGQDPPPPTTVTAKREKS